MGKRRKTGDGSQKPRFVKKENEDFQRTLLNPDSRDFIYDEIDDFEDGRDQLALSNAKKLMAKKKESYEQILGIDVSSSDNDEDGDSEEKESDEDELYMEDDIVDEPEFKLPDERAWGKNKWRYIGTDTTDEKIAKKIHTQDEELAKLEEETARKLQERMAAELQDLVADDLILHEENGEKPKNVALDSALEVDLSMLSRTKKLQLLQRESPEFMPLFDDLKEKCEELTSLALLMEGVKTRQVESIPVSQYITTKYRLTLNYLCVLCMYMFTKCSQRSVGNHPVVGRLAQYRQLLQELSPCDDKLKTDLKRLIPEIILARTAKFNAAPNSTKEKPRKQEKLQLINKKNVIKTEKRKLSHILSDSQMLDDKVGFSLEEREGKIRVTEAISDEEQEVNGSAEVEEQDTLDPDGKRAISYQISKNKGLTPSRKKEQRNPRVKYRNKYKTKLKKRKGQVREVRKELNRYQGEVSGIKSHTIKSRKIK